MPRTHGPRLNRERCREVVDKLGLRVTASNGLGIHIQRYSNHTGYQVWRVYTGGGIAGNSDQAWLAPVFQPNGPARGPFWNKGQLERALRKWRRELKPIGWRTEKRLAQARDIPPDPRTPPGEDDDAPDTATLHLGDAAWHNGPGWYYVIDEYPDEGSCGAFATREEAIEHASSAGLHATGPSHNPKEP